MLLVVLGLLLGMAALLWILVIAILHTTTISAQMPTVAAASVAAAAAPETDSTAISLVVGRSTVLNTGSSIARVSLTSADIADAMGRIEALPPLTD